jgi:hypothetical protein
MVSVQSVYRTLQDLANKDQKGFITPAVFNRFAALAQINIYNELFQELVKSKQLQRQGLDPGRDKSVRKQTLEDLAPFVVSELLIESGSDNNIFYKPLNLSKIISISASGTLRKGITFDASDRTYNRREIEIVYDIEKMDRILTSNLSTPTSEFPVALISEDIEVFPSSIAKIRLTYYRKPGSVNFDGESSDAPPTYNELYMNGTSMFDPQNSLNFMLPSHYDTELVMEIAKLIGVRLRDANLTGFATQEEASE